MNKSMIRIISIFILFFKINAVYAVQNEMLLIKVEYQNDVYPEYLFKKFSILRIEDLKGFKVCKDESHREYKLISNIVFNKGFIVSDIFNDLYLLGCCEFGNVEDAIKKNNKGEITNELIAKYNQQVLDLDSLCRMGDIYVFKDSTSQLQVSICYLNINYCICDSYMENTLKIKNYNGEVAHINLIYSVGILTQKTRCKIKRILNKIY